MSRILLADDDEILAEVVGTVLFDAGHAVGWLSDGPSALAVIRRRRPDLLILDCNMPGMSGILVLREIRNSPDLFDMPVLMLTGRDSSSDEVIARYEGATDYMTKPFDTVDLVSRVDDLLGGRRRVLS